MGKPTEQGTWMDSLADFGLGMNSNPPPVSLPKNQASFATNCTMRGAFVSHRPPFQDISLSFSNASQQSAFEGDQFQGACYYKPDIGAEQIIASIGGRFYTLTPAGTSAAVVDITPSGDANPSSNSIAWLWQSECFTIITDGQSTPLVYDGARTFRTNQGETVATIATGGWFPDEGSSTAVTFTTAYTGPQNSPLYLWNPGANPTLLGKVEVNVDSASSGYSALLTNISDAPGTTHSGSSLIVPGSYSGAVVFGGIMPPNSTAFKLTIYSPYTGPVGSKAAFGASGQLKFTVVASDASVPNITIANDDPAVHNTQVSFAAGATFVRYPTVADQTLATLTGSFTAPAVGGTVPVSLNTYINIDGKVVTIDGALYSVSVVPPTSSTTLYIKTIQSNVNTGQTIQTGAYLATIPQLPPCRLGTYGLGRNWVSLPDGQSYAASDIVGSNSGSIAYKFRDSVLSITENELLAGGGTFRVPSAGQQINAMAFPSTLDASLGQGPLQVLTQDTTYSCNAPIDRTAWQETTNPIQTQSLVGGGSVSLRPPALINGDIWFRSSDGIRSLKLARQDFTVSYANTPQSTEMLRTILADDKTLLAYVSAVNFDNRMLMTATPFQVAGGAAFSKIIALNLDPNSSLREKQSPIYDGVWEGRNILQLITGTFAGVKRCFAFTYDTDAETIGLTEILTTSDSNSFDNGTDRIQWSFESPALFYQPDPRARQLLRLNDGELVVKDLVGTVRFDVYYRPDYATEWTPWHSWQVEDSPTYQPRMGLGQPDLRAADEATGRPYAVGYSFQIKVIVTGHCTIMGCNLFAVAESVTKFAPPLEGLTPLET